MTTAIQKVRGAVTLKGQVSEPDPRTRLGGIAEELASSTNKSPHQIGVVGRVKPAMAPLPCSKPHGFGSCLLNVGKRQKEKSTHLSRTAALEEEELVTDDVADGRADLKKLAGRSARMQDLDADENGNGLNHNKFRSGGPEVVHQVAVKVPWGLCAQGLAKLHAMDETKGGKEEQRTDQRTMTKHLTNTVRSLWLLQKCQCASVMQKDVGSTVVAFAVLN